jgi:hypothetical protein
MLADGRPRLRATALRALARHDRATARGVALDALRAGGSGRLVKAAADVLREGVLSTHELGALVQIAQNGGRSDGERLRAIALIRRDRWSHLAVVLDARATARGDGTRRQLDQELRAWIARSGTLGRAPDAGLRRQIERRLDTLDAEQRRQIEFVLRTTS